ncbi:asparaginase [Amycolatopsis jejuensis]|uniref:asparaginase n=1 Tax=Amycolatopsis jejuensis TaxID=330084 RepID=UPI000526F821|nr:asparaginase [Amycolatopsis jejuensis]
MSDARPKVAVFATGGTMASPAELGMGSIPRLTAEDLMATVPGLAAMADVSAISFRQAPSFELTVPDLVELVENIGRQVSAGATGTVVIQGSDCLEEIAFLLDLLWNGDQPIVVTGAMRNPSLPGADGPANLVAAVRVALSTAARGLGSVVVFNDEIHAARFVQKTHTSSPATFRSTPTGPIGWISEGNVRVAVRPVGRHHVWPDRALVPSVALLKVGFGDDGRLLSSIAERDYSGLVVEALGGGHVPRTMVAPLQQLAARIPVVLASRTGSGELLTHTYGFPGSESDLLDRGLIPAGYLTGLRSRLVLLLLLMRGSSREQVAEAFRKVGTPGAGDLRLGTGKR